MNRPILDARTQDDLRRQLAALAAAYTPEWRLEDTQDDPGAALAELFCWMMAQSIDRLNAIPDKLYIEFLNLIGFRLPAPAAAEGTLQFTVHETVEQPVRVPAHTQVFTPDETGENIVYETERDIEATPAKLTDLFYADSAADWVERVDLTHPQRFFTPNGNNLQCHRFWLSQSDVLHLDCPCQIEIELRQDARYLEPQSAQWLAKLRWTYPHAGTLLPFDHVQAEHGSIVLEKRNALPITAGASEERTIFCEGQPDQMLLVQGIRLRSSPLAPCEADQLFCGDLPILQPEGGYCFGRRPAPYALFYIRSDTGLTKRGTDICLRLDLTYIIDAPADQGPQYDFTQAIIDKRSAVAQTPDDVWISGVVWEYYNGRGWRRLDVQGDRNPFAGQREGVSETRFSVPLDLAACEVNAEPGYYIRIRVSEVENQFSTVQKWIVPFVRTVTLDWSYAQPVPATQCGAENNGQRTEIDHADQITDLNLPVLTPMEPCVPAMYLRFDRSPHAMPLALRFEVVGRVPKTEKLVWESWTGAKFETVSTIDQTGNLHHSGQVMLYLPEPLPQTTLFGITGYWLRLSRSASAGEWVPCVSAIHLNTVTARQTEQQEDLYFDTEPYDAAKTIHLPKTPVASCTVWVDEVDALPLADAQYLAQHEPERVQLCWTDDTLTHCWVRWQQIDNLAMAGPDARVFTLDPYQGTITFGDGRHGRVPAPGDHTIAVRAVCGGGTRGNVPVGQVHSLVDALPRISAVRNLTAMTGGTDRFSQSRIRSVGNQHLRHRFRAAGTRDFEEMVREIFPQVGQVHCFSGRDQKARPACGHVTVVVAGMDGNRVSDQLCDHIYTFLSARCSCCLTTENRLHVCAATVLTVNTHSSIQLEDLDQTATVQHAVIERIQSLIDSQWSHRPIGSQVHMDELWRTVRDTPGVRAVDRILTEGAFDADGQVRLIALEQGIDLPYVVVRSGTHTVRVR